MSNFATIIIIVSIENIRIMSFLKIAEKRYTTKAYDATKTISEKEIEELKKILNLCPSSINSQPWRFTFVSKGEVKDALAELSRFNKERVQKASHIVVFSAIDNVELFEARINANLSAGAVGYYQTFVKPLGEAQIKNWFAHQVYLSLGFFLSACASMEIDATPMEGVELGGYADVLKLDGYTPLFAVAIGYRDENDSNQPSITPKTRLDLEAVIESI